MTPQLRECGCLPPLHRPRSRYVEIYNERVKDLLAPETGQDLDVREDARRGTHIQGALEVSVGSLHELLEYMQQGNVFRTTEAKPQQRWSSLTDSEY